MGGEEREREREREREMRLSHFTVLGGATFAFPDAQQELTTSEKKRERSGKWLWRYGFPIYDNAPTLRLIHYSVADTGFSYAFISIKPCTYVR